MTHHVNNLFGRLKECRSGCAADLTAGGPTEGQVNAAFPPFPPSSHSLFLAPDVCDGDRVRSERQGSLPKKEWTSPHPKVPFWDGEDEGGLRPSPPPLNVPPVLPPLFDLVGVGLLFDENIPAF